MNSGSDNKTSPSPVVNKYGNGKFQRVNQPQMMAQPGKNLFFRIFIPHNTNKTVPHSRRIPVTLLKLP